MKINFFIITIIIFLASCGKTPKWAEFAEIESGKSKSSNIIKLSDIHPTYTTEERLNFEEVSIGYNTYIYTGSFDPTFGYQLGFKSIRTSDDHSDRITAEGIGIYAGLNIMFSHYFQFIYQHALIDKFQTIITDPGAPGKNRYNSSLNSGRYGLKINIDILPVNYYPRFFSVSYMNYTNTLGINSNQIVPKGHILSGGFKLLF